MQVVTAPLWWVVLRIVGSILGLVFLIVVVLFAVNVLLAFTGSPGDCGHGDRTINISPENAAAFTAKWDDLDAKLDAGQSASITLDESEITSRADRYLTEENDTPVKDILVCLHDGYGEASGSLDTPIGNADVKVRGTIELTGEHPEVKIDEIDIGGIPDFFLGPIEGWLESLIDNQLDDINLPHDYEAVIKEGSVQINGTR